MSRSKGGPVPHAMALHSENIFLKYFSNTANSRANAEALGTFLNDPAIAANLTMRNTIKGSVYEYYDNTFSNILKDYLVINNDQIYGIGYRKIKTIKDQVGWHGLITASGSIFG